MFNVLFVCTENTCRSPMAQYIFNHLIKTMGIKNVKAQSAGLYARPNGKINENAKNIEKIAIIETVTVSSKVKDIFKELIKKPKFIFNKLCLTKKYTKLETVTAFTGLLELTRRKKVLTEQKKIFGDITVEKARN